MNKIQLLESELDNIKVGEAITLTAVIAVLAISIIAVVVYKLFTSKEGKTSMPGGWSFQRK